MITLLIIADDFTGALDTGVQFAAYGARTHVVTDISYDFSCADPDIQVLVMDTRTRHLPADAAEKIVYGLTKRAISRGIPYIYKKTDSALRGCVGSELSAVLRASGINSLPFLPSLPKMKRCVRDGFLYIDGCPVKDSVFGRDPLNPVTSSYIPELIQQQSTVHVSIHSLKKPEGIPSFFPEIAVWDAETDSELLQLGKLLQSQGRLSVTAGCAGFGSILAQLLQLSGNPVSAPTFRPGLLVICGSVNPITLQQLEDAEQKGFPRISLSPEQLADPGFWDTPAGFSHLEQWMYFFKQNRRLILDTNGPVRAEAARQNALQMYAKAHGLSQEELQKRIPDACGRILKGLAAQGIDGTFMVIGGDTLAGCMRQLGVCELEPQCELEPGTVLSSFRLDQKPCQIISKSGGFGSRELLSTLAHQILVQPPAGQNHISSNTF